MGPAFFEKSSAFAYLLPLTLGRPPPVFDSPVCRSTGRRFAGLNVFCVKDFGHFPFEQFSNAEMFLFRNVCGGDSEKIVV